MAPKVAKMNQLHQQAQNQGANKEPLHE